MHRGGGVDRFFARQDDGEDRAFAGFALHQDAAAVCLDDFIGDVESEAEAAVMP